MTLYLITSNVYSTVKAPGNRGFSFIEIWMFGIQGTILMAIFEYGIVLCCMKFLKKSKPHLNPVDKWTFFAAITSFALFNVVYWGRAFLSRAK